MKTLGIEGDTWGKIYDNGVFAIIEPGKNTLRHEFVNFLYKAAAVDDLLEALKNTLGDDECRCHLYRKNDTCMNCISKQAIAKAENNNP